MFLRQITDSGGGATEPMGLLSGDFIFVGDVRRPDLLVSAAGLTRSMELGGSSDSGAGPHRSRQGGSVDSRQ